MFLLWSGVMAGILLAYLNSLGPLWTSLRWWVAAVAALLLFIPVPWVFVQTGFFGSFGPLEAFKTVLLPWIAGVGFGIWIYLAIDAVQVGQNAGESGAAARRERGEGAQHSGEGDRAFRRATGRLRGESAQNASEGEAIARHQQDEGAQHSGEGDRAFRRATGRLRGESAQNASEGEAIARRQQDNGAQNAGEGGAAARREQDKAAEFAIASAPEMRRELSFIPIAVAMLAVAFMITDQQYGWLARLQKFSFAGGGLEFSPRAAGGASGPQEIAPGPAAKGERVIGEDRVRALVDFMMTLETIIVRDDGYLRELGSQIDLKQDMDFAEHVVGPTGRLLDILHDANGYNNLGLVIGREHVDAIRAFVRYQRDDVTPKTREELLKGAHNVIEIVWDASCNRVQTLLDLKAVDREKLERAKSCRQTEASVKSWLWSHGTAASFNYALPYGTLLAAMLLNAADELDSAIKDIDEWVAGTPVSDDDPAVDSGKSWLVFRAVNQAMLLLLASDSSGSDSDLALEHATKLAKIGQGLLDSKSWQVQSTKLASAEPDDRLWEIGKCPGELTQYFKRAMLATLQASNNVAFILSQNIEYAERQDRIREMAQRADGLTHVDARCLAVQIPGVPTNQVSVLVERQRAAFFHTAATVQLALFPRETNYKKSRLRLCRAYTYASKAVKIQEYNLEKDTGPFSTGPRPRSVSHRVDEAPSRMDRSR